MPSAPTVLIVNPRAQNGALGKRWPELSGLLRKEIGSFDEEWTERSGHATELCRHAIERGARKVVAIGGDGTINEVANGFFENGAPIRTEAVFGILPFGTGGDFRRTAGTSINPTVAAGIIAAGATTPIDVGVVEYADENNRPQKRIFVNIASFGLSGLVDEYVNTTSKRLGGKVSFLMATVRAGLAYKNQMVRLIFDEDPASARELMVQTVAVANGRYFGGGMQIAPQALLDDGLFDVVSVGDMGLGEMLLSGHRIYRGTHLALEKVSCRRARVVSAQPIGDTPVRLDVDGETPGTLPATFRLLPKALTLLSP
jgi:YegS/Rv2252/BmrU family lipid kinase